MSEVVVGGVFIRSEDIHREAQYHPAPHWDAACHEATRALVIRELMLLRAEELKLCSERRTLDERASQQAITRVIEQELAPTDVSESESREYYASNPQRFSGPALMEASHILFVAKPGERAEIRVKAEGVLAELLSHPERFERLARQHSGCPSGAAGGHLGQISPGDTLPAFEAALEELRPGEIAPTLVETRHGFHIVLLNQRSEGRVLPYAIVAQRLRSFLAERAWRRGLQRYVGQLADRYGVQGFDIASKAPDEPSRSTSTPAGVRSASAAGELTNGVQIRPSSSSRSAVDPKRRLPLIA